MIGLQMLHNEVVLGASTNKALLASAACSNVTSKDVQSEWSTKSPQEWKVHQTQAMAQQKIEVKHACSRRS